MRFSLLVLAAIAAGVVLTWVLCVPAIVRFLQHVPWIVVRSHPPAPGRLEHTIQTEDGVTLRVSYLAPTAEESRGVVVFVHGLNEDRWNIGALGGALREAGFGVVTFDARNHGESGRLEPYTPRPWLTDVELRDTQAVIEFAAKIPCAAQGLAVIGVSKGGNAAICAAAGCRQVQAVVTDGAFHTNALLYYYIRRFMRTHPLLRGLADRLPDVCLISYCAWARLLFRMIEKSRLVLTEHAARRLAKPVLMIHGERDNLVPMAVVRRLRASLRGPSELWIVPGASHNGASVRQPDAYHQRVIDFLSRTTHAERFRGNLDES